MTSLTATLKATLSPIGCDEIALQQGLAVVLADASAILAAVSAATYTTPHLGASIGGHMRHVLEFIQVLVRDLPLGVIAYEARPRNPAYEIDVAMIRDAFTVGICRLRDAVGAFGSDHPLLLRETPAVGSPTIRLASSLGRETLFVIGHSTHHFALVNMIGRNLGVRFSQDLGMAVATRLHRTGIHRS